MPPIYKQVEWTFDIKAWSAALSRLPMDEIKIIAELCDLTPSAFYNWMHPERVRGFAYPNMTNFLKICNALDLRPSDFFTTKDMI